MRLFRLLSWPYLRRHVLRWTLTIAGIVLGVAVFVAMNTVNASVQGAFSDTVRRIAGDTQLQVTAGEFGFDESVLERVQNVPEVGLAVPPVMEQRGHRATGSERKQWQPHRHHRQSGAAAVGCRVGTKAQWSDQGPGSVCRNSRVSA